MRTRIRVFADNRTPFVGIRPEGYMSDNQNCQSEDDDLDDDDDLIGFD